MRLEWSAFAIEDRDEIFDYIEEDSPRAAVFVDDQIRAQVKQLLQYPKLAAWDALRALANWL